ncbi:DUF4880 domain-containing protein [Sphingomonas koreensis]|nr:DUF4880 domain-containing protein [Sphingomonas koreensis]
MAYVESDYQSRPRAEPAVMPNDGGRADDSVRAEAQDWLNRLRSSSGATEQAAFEQWYSADVAHADAYDQLLDNWDDTALVANTPSGRSRRSRHKDRIAVPRASYWLAIAAAMVLVVLAGWGTYQRWFVSANHRAPVEFATRVGEIRGFTLPDGSRITLDTDSALHTAYSVDGRRLVLERGRARFDVAHDGARPFVVTANGTAVIAHGTLFDVQMSGSQVAVRLLRGSVEVREMPDPGPGMHGSRQNLAPGQGIVVRSRKPFASPHPLRAAETRWPSGMLSFEAAPLAEVVAAANRYNTTKIIIRTPAAGSLRFTGTFRATEPVRLVRMLTATFGLTMSRDARGDYVLAMPAAPPPAR